MAERRMFAKTIIDSDAFLDMPLSAQCLYFHLAMRADDDGFINNPKKIQRMIGGADDDLKLLCVKRFIIPFDSGIVVIKHWRLHNYIQKDRYKETVYTEEKATLIQEKNGAYTECIHDGNTLETQVRLGKDSIELGKDSIEVEEDKQAAKPKRKKNSFDALIAEYAKGVDDSNREKVVMLLGEWLKVRKAKRAAMTDFAIQLNLNKLDALSKQSNMDIPQYLEAVIAKGWSAFYAVNNYNTQKGVALDGNNARLDEESIMQNGYGLVY